MALTEYRRKRHFEKTPEPAGTEAPPGRRHNPIFVVQKHDATRLHYDFRLEFDGVLKSWAVPKGPSLNPADKRLAMQTEDHPLDYAGFEGVIPEGHYGAGPVMVWDRGTFEVEGNQPMGAQLQKGDLKFTLHGHKLRGGFVLVQLHGDKKNGRPWLLIKHRDAFVDPEWNIEEHDGSVLSGRDLEKIEEDLPASMAATTWKSASPPAEVADLEGARKSKMPKDVRPMLATLADKPYSDPNWLFEIKWDGIRALAFVEDGHVRLQSRTGRNITAQYPDLRDVARQIDAGSAILDGEIVVLDEDGSSNFERLQSRMNVRSPSAELVKQALVTYYVFDLLYCDDYDLRQTPLIERKEMLRRVLRSEPPVVYADHQVEKGRELLELARSHGLEGIIGKQLRSVYTEDRSRSWLKVKITRDLDGVVGGYTAPRGSRECFGALLVGLYDGRHLRPMGGVGTGFDNKTQKMVYERLEKLRTERCPFEPVPETLEKSYWVKPELVAHVKYREMTSERQLRAAVFLSLRDGRQASDCRFDTQTDVVDSAEVRAEAREATPAQNSNGQGSRGSRGASARKHGSGIRGSVLSNPAEIEQELFHGRAEVLDLEIDSQRLHLTNLNKIYFPDSGYTKRSLLAYYYSIADHIVPFLKDRPLVLRRYPNGIRAKAFFQKDAARDLPDWLPTVVVYSEDEKKDIHYAMANDRAALLFLTNLGCIDHNPWSSRRDDLDHPDYVFFDLDPSDGTEFETVISIAQAVLKKLVACGLKVFLKTSGATGFHMYIPLKRVYTFEQIRTFADIIGHLVAADEPQRVTAQRIVSKRPRGTVMIDAYQNASGRPLAAAYAARAFPKAPVSAPIGAHELRPGLRADWFTIKSMSDRLKKEGDLWADFWKERQELEPALAKLQPGQSPVLRTHRKLNRFA
jgi:bifunctional non-homologous end joining protein LigD